MPKLVHKATATVCGGARRDHGLTSSWDVVTCAACLAKRPGGAPVQCRACGRQISGRCVHWTGSDVWLHDTCSDAFERTEEGRRLKAQTIDRGPACSVCGRAVQDHADRRPCPNVMNGVGGKSG